jgi:hypothetical protein
MLFLATLSLLHCSSPSAAVAATLVFAKMSHDSLQKVFVVRLNFLLSGLPNFRKAKGRLIFLAVGKALETNHKDTNL